jgi:hypothetical protein
MNRKKFFSFKYLFVFVYVVILRHVVVKAQSLNYRQLYENEDITVIYNSYKHSFFIPVFISYRVFLFSKNIRKRLHPSSFLYARALQGFNRLHFF